MCRRCLATANRSTRLAIGLTPRPTGQNTRIIVNYVYVSSLVIAITSPCRVRVRYYVLAYDVKPIAVIHEGLLPGVSPGIYTPRLRLMLCIQIVGFLPL